MIYLSKGIIGTVLLVALGTFAGLGSTGEALTPAAVGHFHWRPQAGSQAWVIVLPGASGLKVLGDETHYFKVADQLNQAGWSVLVLDYKAAYQAVQHPPKLPTGEKIAWVTEQAVHWLHQAHPETANQPGALAGWSLGAEGVFVLANDHPRATGLGLRALATYYPAQEEGRGLTNTLPLLVLTGEADDVTRVQDIQTLLKKRPPSSAAAELHTYPGAQHGFDVASLTQRRRIRLLPLVGPQATLQYHQPAAEDAAKRLQDFLRRHLNANTPSSR